MHLHLIDFDRMLNEEKLERNKLKLRNSFLIISSYNFEIRAEICIEHEKKTFCKRAKIVYTASNGDFATSIEKMSH